MEIDLSKNVDGVRPSDNEIAVYLIKAELKHSKFTKGLERVGFDTSFINVDFGRLILKLLGFKKRPDEMYESYYDLLEQYLDKVEINGSEDIYDRLALDILTVLKGEKIKSEKSIDNEQKK